MSKNVDKLIENLSDEEREELVKSLLSGKVKDKTERKRQRSKPSVNEDFIVDRSKQQSRGKKEPVRGRENTWVDSGSEHSDIETPKFERVERRRSKSRKVDLECHMCGKKFKADPRYVYAEFHRCNRCTGR